MPVLAPRLVTTRHAHSPRRTLFNLHRKRPRRVAWVAAGILVPGVFLAHLRVQVRLQIPPKVAVHGRIILGEVRGRADGFGGGDLEAVAFVEEAFVEEGEGRVFEGEGEGVGGGGDFVGRGAAGDGPGEGGERFGGRVVVRGVRVAGPGHGVGGAVGLDGVEEGDEGVGTEGEVGREVWGRGRGGGGG